MPGRSGCLNGIGKERKLEMVAGERTVETMSEAKRRKEVLKRKLSAPWDGEPRLGSIIGEEEIAATVQAIRESVDPNVGFGMSDGEVDGFENAFAAYVGTKHCVTCNGAGTGIDMAIMALDLEPGDEVVTQAVNFRAVPMAIAGQRGKIVFAEVDPKTLQLDPNDVEKRITPRTRAIFPTHMNGMSAPMDDLLKLAQRHPHPKHGPLKVMGDAARACGGGYKGTKIGKLGWMNVFSFHTMKNMTTLGEGGAITTDDSSIISRLHGFRQFGGEGWGSNYKMSKCQAAVGLVQLGKLEAMVAARRRLAHARHKMLEGCPGLQLPAEPEGHYHSYYLYSMLVSREWAGEKRDRLLALLRDEYGVDTVVANPPVQNSFPYIARLTAGQELPISQEVGQRLFCAPMHPSMSDEDNEYISAAIWEAVERIGRQG
jgi:dTDP-4-amino-4,6-dideoxygalactose transaminase